MSTANALAILAIANDLAAVIANAAQAFGSVQGVYARAQAEGRDVSDEELDAARAERLQVIGELDAEILRRQGGAPPPTPG